jgi:hypothetical protein
MSFDNIINKFKESTKQAADQMGRATKIARLKMDVRILMGERTRNFEAVGERAYQLYQESGTLDGTVLRERVRNEFTQIERLDGRLRDIESQIADLQAVAGEVADATDVQEVAEPKAEGDENQSSGG